MTRNAVQMIEYGTQKVELFQENALVLLGRFQKLDRFCLVLHTSLTLQQHILKVRLL